MAAASGLLAGGASLLSTARDFLRYAQMLPATVLGKTRVMHAETANSQPATSIPRESPSPAMAGSVARCCGRPIIPPGTIGGGGAAGTLFWFDRLRVSPVVFTAQVMYGGPARSPFQKRLFAAIDADVAG